MMISYRQKTNIALFLALLFHVSGAIGMLLTPYKDWFIGNTALNLVLMNVLLVVAHKERTAGFWIFAALCFVTGMATEMIGVNTGLLFGTYSYGETLGIKLYGVPLLIGVNWFMAVFCSGTIIYRMNEWVYARIGAGPMPSKAAQVSIFVFDAALLTTFFDWVLEPAAIQLGYWQWQPEGVVPVYNFLCWFLISAVLLVCYRLIPFNRDNQFAVHLFIIQVLFFLLIQTFL